jgi:hypothetical protein
MVAGTGTGGESTRRPFHIPRLAFDRRSASAALRFGTQPAGKPVDAHREGAPTDPRGIGMPADLQFTRSRCPTWIRSPFNPLIRFSSATLTPFAFAMPLSVSPDRTR